ncbi:hypothetical protein [Geodermatophilus sp. SYSU D00766]
MTASTYDDEVRATVVDPEDRTAPSGPSRVRPARRRRVPEWLVALAVGVVTWLVGWLPYLLGEFVYYAGDQYDQNMPMWHRFGEDLLAGRWPVPMDPAAWMGGNNAGEALTGIWNPVNLAEFVLVSRFDDLALAAAVVSVQFLGLLAMGTFLLARSHGAHRWPAAAVGVAVPFSGFALFYEAGGWPYHLMAFTWVTWFWWAAHRHTRGRLNPLVPVVFGALAMTTGSPYGACGVVVVLLGLAVELLVRRRTGRLVHLAVVGLCVGAVALPVYLPLLATNEVSWRSDLAGLANDTFLVPDLGDLAAGSSPSYLPSMTYWEGVLETRPSVYLAWFVLPLLPWLRWDRLRRRLRLLLGTVVTGSVFLVLTLGPSNLWLFRWPIRFVDYLYLSVAVLFAVALSAGLTTAAWRRRAVASAAIVGGGTYLAWAVQPSGLGGTHLTALALVAAGTALAVLAHHRRGLPALGAVLVAGTAAVVALQGGTFPYRPDGVLWRAPSDVAAMQEGAAPYRGTVLQVATMNGVTTEQMRRGELLFGNMQQLVGHETVGSYTGIGFDEFGDELCMGYRGEPCADAWDRLWQPTGEGVPVPLVDALRVSTLVVQRVLVPDVADTPPPPGWAVAEVSDARVVWVREQPLTGEGRVSWSAPGVDVVEDTARLDRELVGYRSDREVVGYRADAAGEVLFARLAWPGYTATVDGRPVEVTDGPAGLVSVEVPAGEHELVLRYEAPGLRTGALAALAAGVVAVVQAVVWWATGRRRRRRR